MRDLNVLNSFSNRDKLFILSAGYRKIKLTSVFVKPEIILDTEDCLTIDSIKIPNVTVKSYSRAQKIKKELPIAHEYGIKNISTNFIDAEKFISSN